MAETEFRHEDRDSGSIGIGAMIVFIALILVAAVASTIIIKTAEELQQNAENTSDDTRKQISGKVSLVDVFVKSADDPLNAAATNTDGHNGSGGTRLLGLHRSGGRRYRVVCYLQGVTDSRWH